MTSPAHGHTHLLTPGDHYSPRTGSAVPTVVHGLASATPEGEPSPRVLIAAGTYPERYEDAECVEYPLRPGRRTDRYVDAATALLASRRPAAQATLRPALVTQASWAPSVVLAHNLPQAVPLVDAARHVPVLYAHNQLFRTYSAREARRALGPVRAVVAVSDHLAGALSDRLPPELRSRVVVVRNGVDTSAFEARERPDDGVLDVVFVGRVIPDKGADVLVDAVVRLGRPDVRLLVVGSAGFAPTSPLTPYERSLRERAAGAGDRIRFRRFVPREQVAEVLESADVAVVPSRWPDPCPLTVLEGMAAGAAVVASRIGGIPEMVGDGGLLVAPGDVTDLAEALDGLAGDDGLRRRITSASTRRGRERPWTVVARELRDTLRGAES
ncbi:MAG: cotSA 2 [Cellulosimicrobium sp.]|nr:cotSA 2 [Cellulosimicrobium sp.]